MARTDDNTRKSSAARKPVGRPRRDGKPHLTRARVFAVCSKLIAEHGYAGTSIRMMAAALDASTASLFNLFGAKEGLLNELITHAAAPSLSFHNDIAELDLPAAVALYKSIYEEVSAVASADRDHVGLFYLPELRKPEFTAAQKVRADMIGHYQRLIVAGVTQGTLHTEHPELAAEQVFQLTETCILGGAATDAMEPSQLAAATADFCLKSLLVARCDLPAIRTRAAQVALTMMPTRQQRG